MTIEQKLLNYTSEKALINYVNFHISEWYKNFKIDYGVIGSGKARIEGDKFIVDYIENGVENSWSMAYCYSYIKEEGKQWFFDCWSSDY